MCYKVKVYYSFNPSRTSDGFIQKRFPPDISVKIFNFSGNNITDIFVHLDLDDKNVLL